jgi:hypothetical protein
MIEAIGAGMGAPELVDALDRSIRPSLHFARDANGCPRLVAVGRGLRPAILSIFEESERPLRFTEVRERLVDRGYPVPIDTTLRNAIRGSGMLLFGRSVYGTRAHIGMDPAALEETRAELIEIINEEPERQWHAAELAEELQDRGEVHTEIDHYKVGAILEGADDVAFLGRFVWMAKNRRGLSTRDRREVAQLFEAVLIRAGRPLKKKEIRAAIEHARGLNTTFLPQPTERVIRLGNGRWGLIDRDCRLSSEEMEPAFQGLESILTARGRALHTSELLPALANIGLDLPRALVEEFVGRAQIDQRFRVARGGYIVLATWQSTGRATLSEAYEKILKEWQGSVSTDEVQGRVETIIERPVHRWSVATWLNSLGLLFDQQSGRWEKPPENEDEATE